MSDTKGWKLVSEKTGKDVKLPASLNDFRGDPVTVVRFSPPQYSHQSGYVYVKSDWGAFGEERFYPGVVGCKIVRRKGKK